MAENVLNRHFEPRGPGEILTSDITYIPTAEDCLYLAVTLDLGTRKVVGWSMAETMTEILVSDALVMAIDNVQINYRAIHHSDRGAQYASKKFQVI